MKPFIPKLVLTFIPAALFAHQANNAANPSAVNLTVSPDYHCEQDQGFLNFCKSMEERDIEYNRALAKAAGSSGAKAKVAQKAKDSNWGKMLSPDNDSQINGVTGEVKDLNSRGNGNKASKEVTDKSLSLIEQMARQENKLLDRVGKSVENGPNVSAADKSSFSASGHTMREFSKEEAAPLSLQQQFAKQSDQIARSQAAYSDRSRAERTAVSEGSSGPKAPIYNDPAQSSLRESLSMYESSLLNSPSTVLAVGKVVKAMEIAEQQRQERLAAEATQRLAAERLAAQAQAAQVVAERQAAQKLAADGIAARRAVEEFLDSPGSSQAASGGDGPCTTYSDLPDPRPKCQPRSYGTTPTGRGAR